MSISRFHQFVVFTETRDTDVSCLYSGLVFVEGLDSEHQETHSVCASTSATKHFYSSASKLFLVVYWYNSYAILNLALCLTALSCQLVSLNFCELTRNCPGSQFLDVHSVRMNQTNCRLYLQNLSDKFSSSASFSLSKGNEIQLVLTQGRCAVIVFRREYLNRAKVVGCKFQTESTSVRLSIHTSVSGNYSYMYKVIAFFQQPHHIFHTTEQIIVNAAGKYCPCLNTLAKDIKEIFLHKRQRLAKLFTAAEFLGKENGQNRTPRQVGMESLARQDEIDHFVPTASDLNATERTPDYIRSFLADDEDYSHDKYKNCPVSTYTLRNSKGVSCGSFTREGGQYEQQQNEHQCSIQRTDEILGTTDMWKPCMENTYLYFQTHPSQASHQQSSGASQLLAVEVLLLSSSKSWVEIIVEEAKHIVQGRTQQKLELNRQTFFLEQLPFLNRATHYLSHLPLDDDHALVLQIRMQNFSQREFSQTHKLHIAASSELSGGAILVNWEEKILVYKQRMRKYVSLPGTLEFLKLSFGVSTKNESGNVQFVVNVRWLEGIHNCSCVADSRPSVYMGNRTKLEGQTQSDIFQHSYGVIQKDFYHSMFDSPFIIVQDSQLNHHLLQIILFHFATKLSWGKGTKICKYDNASLPFFSSRTQLGNFVAKIKCSQHMPALEAIYIQHSAQIKAQVCALKLFSFLSAV